MRIQMRRIEGYITREGQFIDVSVYENLPGPSNHNKYCWEHETNEELLMNEYQWVKLSTVVPEIFIFHGYELSTEQIRTLRELGYEVDEERV